MKIQKMFKGICRRPPSVSPPTELAAPERVIISMKQHAGRVCDPCVEAGDTVAAGQVVGIDRETGSHAVFASVGGKVEGIVSTYDTAGQKVSAVSLKAEGRAPAVKAESGLPALAGPGDLAGIKPDALLKALDASGCYLTPSCGPLPYYTMNGVEMIRGIKHLIIKCVDHDPPVAPNQAALTSATMELELGVKALALASQAEQVILAIPAGGRSEELYELTSANRWTVAEVRPGHFPFAEDRLLINQLTGKVVSLPDGDPRDVGVVLQDLRSALEVGRVLMSGQADTTQVVTVAGDVSAPQSFRIRIGTPIGDLIDAAGGFSGRPGKVMLGGPMMGFAQFDLGAPVTKQTSGVFVQALNKIERFSSHPCIHCGRCVEVCPVNLVPGELSKMCEFAAYDSAEERDLFHCIECGCCAYVCPAKRPMVQLMRLGKSELMAARMEQ